MKVTIPKMSFLRQLPVNIQGCISINEIPDHLIFEGDPKLDETDELEGEYPNVKAVLTPMEWFMFSELIRRPGGATIVALALHLRTGSPLGTHNCVAVHIKGMRKKFMQHNLPFRIVTVRGNIGTSSSYRLDKNGEHRKHARK